MEFDKDYNRSDLTYEEIEMTVNDKLRLSMGWMFIGLVMTVIAGYFTLNSALLPMVSRFYWFFIIAEFGLVIAFSAMAFKANENVLKLMFIAYSIMNGVTLSLLGAVYTGESIVAVFLGATILFGILALYGYITKDDLSGYRPYLFGGLIALIVVSLVNVFFIKSSGLDLFLAYGGVLLFLFFTAYDVNRIKKNLIQFAYNDDQTILNRIALVGALSLYLDFINLFLYLLRIFGKRE